MTANKHSDSAVRTLEDRRAGAVVGAYLREQVDVVLFQEGRVRDREPDALRRLRVGVRRLRSGLEAFPRFLDAEHARFVVAELCWFNTMLGDARDLEMVQARLNGQIALVPSVLVRGPVAARTGKFFAGRRIELHDRVVSTLDSSRQAELRTAMERIFDHDSPDASLDAAAALPGEVARSYRRLESRMAAVAEYRHPGPERDEALHDVRKAAKCVWDASMAAAQVCGRPAARFGKQMRDLQRFLGVHQDSVVCRRMLRTLSDEAEQHGESAFTYGLLYAREEHRAHDVEHGLPGEWRQRTRPKHRQWLTPS
ncbi:CHAD domain-containing protein [Allokutzneria sp. NRRL B-24872]|uniref:CHAD domain-containing protein n=1 Tax=Allokutzneria sp. NRRL B-24872 TaxID=1137961 RepID=UPI000A3878BE|nr:CHAD domain-containing protein [Allokutzneria sp. NRRL B-24872]